MEFFFLSCLIRYMWIYDDPRRNSSAILSAIYLVNFKFSTIIYNIFMIYCFLLNLLFTNRIKLKISY